MSQPLKKNLISVSQFTPDNNVSIEFLPNSFFVKNLKTETILLRGKTKDGLYSWPIYHAKEALTTHLEHAVTTTRWHDRLGHPAFRIVQKIISQFHLPVLGNKNYSLCEACQKAKSHRLHFPSSELKATFPLELIFTDVWGAAPCSSHNGNKYYVSFVDSYSRFTWLYPIGAKSDVTIYLCNFRKI